MLQRYIVLAAISVIAAAPAFATCTGNPHNCGGTTTPPSNPGNNSNSNTNNNHNSANAGAIAGAVAIGQGGAGGAGGQGGAGGAGGAGGSARQGQGQQQGQGQAQRASSSANGAGAGAGSGSGIVTIQGAQAGSGDRYQSVVLPDVPPAMAPTMVGGAISTTATACGPAQRVVAEPIYGRERGMFTSTEVFLGNTEKTEPYMDERGDIAPYMLIKGQYFGHQVIYATGMPGVSSGTSIGLGGFGNSGGGNIGGGQAGGMQRMVTTIQLRLCQIETPAKQVQVPVAAIAPAAYVPPPQPAAVPKKKPRPVVHNKCLADARAMCVRPTATK